MRLTGEMDRIGPDVARPEIGAGLGWSGVADATTSL
jgi:hypothetical protein